MFGETVIIKQVDILLIKASLYAKNMTHLAH